MREITINKIAYSEKIDGIMNTIFLDGKDLDVLEILENMIKVEKLDTELDVFNIYGSIQNVLDKLFDEKDEEFMNVCDVQYLLDYLPSEKKEETITIIKNKKRLATAKEIESIILTNNLDIISINEKNDIELILENVMNELDEEINKSDLEISTLLALISINKIPKETEISELIRLDNIECCLDILAKEYNLGKDRVMATLQ